MARKRKIKKKDSSELSDNKLKKIFNNISSELTNKIIKNNSEINDENMSSDDDESIVTVKPKLSKFVNADKPQSNNKNSVKTKKIHIKPIIVDLKTHNLIGVKNIIEKLKLNEKYLLKHNRDNTLQISTYSKEDKSKIIEKLKEVNQNLEDNDNKIQFHTFSEMEDKIPVFVLKKHYYMTCAEMANKLKSLNLPIHKVSFLNNSQSMPSYLVYFTDKSIDVNYLILNHRIIDHLIVHWQKLNKNQRQITQCYNCQQYGHTSRNCGRPYKCVKCTEDHKPGECSRTSKEDGDPSCVNCKGNHTANSRQCEFYKKYKEKIDAVKAKKQVPQLIKSQVFNSSPAPWMQSKGMFQEAFPKINAITSKTPGPRERLANLELDNDNNVLNFKNPENICNNDKFQRFAKLQDEFSAIPDIDKTLDLFQEVIEQLKNTDSHEARLSILLRFQFAKK